MPEVHRPQAQAGSASFLIGGSFVCCEQCSAWWGSRTWRVSFPGPLPTGPTQEAVALQSTPHPAAPGARVAGSGQGSRPFVFCVCGLISQLFILVQMLDWTQNQLMTFWGKSELGILRQP